MTSMSEPRQFTEAELDSTGLHVLRTLRHSIAEASGRGVRLTKRAFFRRNRAGRICRACLTGTLLIAGGTQSIGRRNIEQPISKAAGLLTGKVTDQTRSLVWGIIEGWDNKHPFSERSVYASNKLWLQGYTVARIIDKECEHAPQAHP